MTLQLGAARGNGVGRGVGAARRDAQPGDRRGHRERADRGAAAQRPQLRPTLIAHRRRRRADTGAAVQPQHARAARASRSPAASRSASPTCSTARCTTTRTTTSTCRCRFRTRCRSSASRRARRTRRTASTRARRSTSSTKSGTNLFHGDLFEFVRHHRFNATNPFARDRSGDRRARATTAWCATSSAARSAARSCRTGCSSSAPTRARGPTRRRPTSCAFVPTAAMLAGDFTAVASAACNARGRDHARRAVRRTTGSIPALLSPAAVRIARRAADDDRPVRPRQRHQPAQTSRREAGDRQDRLADHPEPLALRPLHGDDLLLGPAVRRIAATSCRRRSAGATTSAQSLAIGDTMVLSNTVVNNIRFAVNRTASTGRTPTSSARRTSASTRYSYLGRLHAPHRHRRLQPRRRHRERRHLPHQHLRVRRRPDDDPRESPVRVRRAAWRSGTRCRRPTSGRRARSPSTAARPAWRSPTSCSGGRSSSGSRRRSRSTSSRSTSALYAPGHLELSPTMTMNYGVRWEPWFPQQHQNGADLQLLADRFRAGRAARCSRRRLPGFTYPGDEGFPNGKAGMYTDWLNIAPRVGVAWDPNGRRPHVGARRLRHEQRLRQRAVLLRRRPRAAVGLGGAPARGPASGRFDDPFARHRRDQSVPGHVRRRTRRSRRTARSSCRRHDLETTRVHSWNVSVQQQLGDNMAVSASYLGNYMMNLWGVVTGNPGVIPAGASPTGPCTLNTATGPQTFPNCSRGAARPAPRDHAGESGGRPLHRLPRLLHRSRLAEVPRAAALGAAPRGRTGSAPAPTTRCRSARGIRRRAAARSTSAPAT